MTRSDLTYAERKPLAPGGFDPNNPEPGFYKMRLRRGAVPVGVRIWWGPPVDPWTGEEVPERGDRLQASINGENVELERVWPSCAREPSTESEHDYLIGLQQWGQQHDPDGPHANPNKPVDLLSAPLPF